MSQLMINGQTIQQYFQQHGNANLLLQRSHNIQPAPNSQFIITRPMSPQIIQQTTVQAPQQQTQQIVHIQQHHPPQHQQLQQIQNFSPVEDVKTVTKKNVWMLVELESDEKVNLYAVIDSKDVIGQQDSSYFHTGKIVNINYKGNKKRASIVIVSEDKNFIFTELNTLNKLSEDNLRAKGKGNGNVKKRRRLSETENLRKLPEDESSNSTWSSISHANPEKELMHSNHMFQPKIVRSPIEVPPMTFDQQTQTDPRYTGASNSNSNISSNDIATLLALNQQLLNDQTQLKADTQYNRTSISNFSEEMSTIRKYLENISNKLENMDRVRSYEPAQASKQEKENKEYFVIAENLGTKTATQVEIQGNESSYMLSADDAAEFTIEEVNQDGSGRASSSSRFSYHDNSTMMSNGSFQSGEEKSFGRSQSMLSIGSSSGISSTPIQRKQQKKEKTLALLSQIQKDWNCEGGEGDDHTIIIGSNKTSVPAHVLRSIDWENYRQATRKLLVTLFSRETLATHSLTGKPSPAFHDQNKPVKTSLDPNIIGDIVHIVSKYCDVTESQVRTAITTKCADENKMFKQRKQQEKRQQFKQPNVASNVASSGDTQENKENIVNR